MTELDQALARLGGALGRLEAAVEVLQSRQIDMAQMPELREERNHLAKEVEALRAQAARDAELRAEAAATVRAALSDLYDVVKMDTEQEGGVDA